MSAPGRPGFAEELAREAFRRTGHALRVLQLPHQRALANANAGIEDGDLFRTAGLEAHVGERTAELKRAVDRAESANRAKSEFLSRMSHELRTPMNAILGFAQILEMSGPSPQQLKWAGEIRRAGDHLLQMIEDLLDLARIEVGKLPVRIATVDIGPVVSEVVAIVQPLVGARGLRLAVEPGLGLDGRVEADPLRLRQVLVNLLSNAAKYNRDGGSITVRAEAREGWIRLSVADSGKGIAAARLEALFQPFERLGAEGGPVEGSGIGLALSKQLAAMMGGRIGVESREGVGSTFWLDLPRAGALPAAPPTPGAGPDLAADTACTLLFIEAKPSNVEVVRGFLGTLPAVRLHVANDGAIGLAMAAQEPPDIVLLDIQLPGMDGYQVLRRLRANPRLADVPAIALTAGAMRGDRQRGLDAGFDDYLVKPVDRQALLGAIGRALSARRGPPAS